jgi:hypothetical protein
MSREDDDRPSAFTDVRRGLGLLFRAARTTAKKLPKGNLEELAVTSAKEVGRAFESVASTVAGAIEREVLGKRKDDDKKDPPSGGA